MSGCQRSFKKISLNFKNKAGGGGRMTAAMGFFCKPPVGDFYRKM
jgi:hypothetical protein